nr:probable protein phosphatase 2C 52 [Malus domestica]
MGGCVSTSSRSTRSSRSNGERVAQTGLGIGFCGQKRTKKTFSDHSYTLQNLHTLPNRIFTNGKSQTSCIFTQQGRKGINQDAMVVWEDFMSDDAIFCGVFDGHGPHGHLVARKVRDALPVKLLSFLYSYQSRLKGSSTTCFKGSMKKSDGGDTEKDGSAEEKLNLSWRDAFLKSYKSMDKELRSHPISRTCSAVETLVGSSKESIPHARVVDMLADELKLLRVMCCFLMMPLVSNGSTRIRRVLFDLSCLKGIIASRLIPDFSHRDNYLTRLGNTGTKESREIFTQEF